MKILNAFSLNMLSVTTAKISTQEVDIETLKAELCLKDEDGYAIIVNSFIGHADTANILSNLLGRTIPMNRESISLGNETVLVAQYSGPRLPEGATTLPQGAKFVFYRVTVEYKCSNCGGYGNCGCEGPDEE